MVLGFLNNPVEWAVVALIALLFFGNRLPSVMRSLGESVTEFKKGMEGKEDEAPESRKRVEPSHEMEEPPANASKTT